jgi:hypothetical protein
MARESKAQKIARLKEELDAAIAESTRGAPVKYNPEFAIRVTDMCLLGLTNGEIAQRFGVDSTKIDDWIKNIPQFRKAVWDGREGADQHVARAMYLAAKGYEHPEDDIRTVSLGGNAGSEIVLTPTIKRYAPNDRAAQVWLRNRQRARWPAIGPDGPGSDDPDAAQARAQAVRAAVRAAMAETAPPIPSDDEDNAS